jgi:acyl-CoA reductase-like NAD-dependent aldehyde dehydrogenase
MNVETAGAALAAHLDVDKVGFTGSRGGKAHPWRGVAGAWREMAQHRVQDTDVEALIPGVASAIFFVA